MATFMAYVLVFGFAFGVFWFLYKNFKKGMEIKKTKENGIAKYSAIYAGFLKHIDGLPIASGSIIEFYYGKKNITFKKDNQVISLECNKIVSLDLVLGKDVKNNIATGAVAGKYLLGGLGGAALGAILTTTFYFVIIYTKDGENKTILLDSTGSDLPFKKILDNFKIINQSEIKNIEL